jgi:MoxR-like ATPase
LVMSQNDVDLLQKLRNSIAAVRAELHKKIVGQDVVIDDLLACFLSGGHSLIVGVPGLAKTMLVQSLAKCLDLEFNRIQFTPDLMPADITGSEILFEDRAAGVREFRFVKGPVFTNIVLADEINRTPPKTQSALLQAMQEKEVTCGGRTWPLPYPFRVLATQNPIEQEGTYPLPEAQQDRFMFSIDIGYPGMDAEMEIVRKATSPQDSQLSPVLDKEELDIYGNLILRLPAADSVIAYAVSLARATRPADAACPADMRNLITWGAGPRASQFLVLAAKAYAALDGRPAPDIGDVKRAAHPVLRHRIVRSFNAEVENVSANDIVSRLLAAI